MKKGISLIVLVITIIVMIILAASVVITLNNTDIINKASQTVDLTNEKQVQDLAMLIWSDAYLDNLRDNDLVDEVKTKLEQQGVKEDKWDIDISNTGVSITVREILPTVPTYISVVSVNGSSVQLQATGGTNEIGDIAGYQYSMDGTNWTEVLSEGTSYTTDALTTGKKWTVYIRTVSGAGKYSEFIEYKIIKFRLNAKDYYAKDGMNWYQWSNSNYNNSGKWICASLSGGITDRPISTSGYNFVFKSGNDGDIVGASIIEAGDYSVGSMLPADIF